MFFPYPYMWEDSGECLPIIKVNKKIRCDGCGKYMKIDDAYLVIDNTYLRCHMKEKCLSNVYIKAKAKRGEGFELASMGAVDYGKV